MDSLPQDPNILLSFINMKLRDYYSSFHELCNDLDLDEREISRRLETEGYFYDPASNRFAPK